MDKYETRMAPRFREQLIRRATELGEILHHEADAAHNGSGRDVGDFKDVAAEDTIASLDQVQAAHAAVELEQVRAALRRITDGSYGECLDCGDPIDLRRLDALPATAYCAACQSVHEKQH